MILQVVFKMRLIETEPVSGRTVVVGRPIEMSMPPVRGKTYTIEDEDRWEAHVARVSFDIHADAMEAWTEDVDTPDLDAALLNAPSNGWFEMTCR